MKSTELKGINRILLIIGGIALFLANYFPIWRIQLDAPQYPEGLELLIYSDKLAGNVDIINGLNHYIGMKTLHTADFPEFVILPYLITFFAFAFVLVAIFGKKSVAYGLLVGFALFGILAMIDFWKWEYDYGHNLDPNAAIIVPGMSYQPPLIGFKQLLNFGAFSMPALGGWIFIGSGVILAYIVVSEWMAARKKSTISSTKQIITSVLIMAATVSGIQSCGPKGATPIQAGVDACAHCKMTISDLRFASELLTKKGRVYKFDDLQCLISYQSMAEFNKEDIKENYLSDFNSRKLEVAHSMVLLHSEALRSPMGGNTAAFKNKEELSKANKEFNGNVVIWSELTK